MTLSGRDAFRSELTAVAGRDGRVVCLETLPRNRNDHPFEAAHPDRYFSLPNAGSVLTQMVTGLGAAGFRPFVVVTPGAVEGRVAVPRTLWRDCLQAGATVVMPPEKFPEGYDEVRGLSGIPLAVPCGEKETRAVVRQAVRSGRPHCLVLGGGPGTDLSWESSEPSVAAARLISVGEAGTRLALAARAAAPGLGHAHLVYLDDARLSAAVAELGAWTGTSVVVAAPRLLGPVVRALRDRLPEDSVRGVPAAVGGGGADVAEVLAAAAVG
ncbi:transketolase [Streptomyces sp. RB17]|uniref:transketolase n=1 Tax=Streptomyces sp. RB17 TaxID=2585197 RepID=UPI0012971887|nr:transketolase [Streptomyces sp. RB17]